uniref:Uncharacterized protein n=1 Tax=Tetranychus urticae TaxID=32264 RepID=T1KC88_TETUR
MFPKVFLLLLLSLFGVKFSSQTIIESSCNDKYEPTKYRLFDGNGNIKLTAVFQMESTNAFEPILSLELFGDKPYSYDRYFRNDFSFGFSGKRYRFNCIKYPFEEATCNSGFTDRKGTSNCVINKDTNACKWLLKVGMDLLMENEKGIETSAITIITNPLEVEITLSNSHLDETVAANKLTPLPIHHWSYARYCEYNKKIYDIDGDMITLKKDNSSFELFIYRLTKYDYKKPRHVTLINAKNSSISISCDDDRNDIIVSTKTGSKEVSVLDKYIFRKHIDGLRCGISLSIEMESEHSSFSFNDTPLKLIYKANDYDIIIQEVKFESDSIAVDEPRIETTSISSVDQQDSTDEPKIEMNSIQ